MATLSGLLSMAVSETLAMRAAPIEVWTQEGRPFGPGIPAGVGSGSYRTSRTAMDALARLTDGLLENDAELARAVSQDSARMPELTSDEAANWRKFRECVLGRLGGQEGVDALLPGLIMLRPGGDARGTRRVSDGRPAAPARVAASFNGHPVPPLFPPERALDLLLSIAAHIATTPTDGTEPRKPLDASTNCAAPLDHLLRNAPGVGHDRQGRIGAGSRRKRRAVDDVKIVGCGANIGSRAKQEFWGLTWITRPALHTKFQVRFCF